MEKLNDGCFLFTKTLLLTYWKEASRRVWEKLSSNIEEVKIILYVFLRKSVTSPILRVDQ